MLSSVRVQVPPSALHSNTQRGITWPPQNDARAFRHEADNYRHISGGIPHSEAPAEPVTL